MNALYTLFIIILYCNNGLVWIIMSCMFSLFLPQVLEILDLEVLEFLLFIEFSILCPVHACFQMNNSCMYVFSKSNHSLIDFLAVSLSIPFFVVLGRFRKKNFKLSKINGHTTKNKLYLDKWIYL